MASIFMIATIMKEKDIIGFRLLDCNTKDIKDVGYKNVVDALRANLINIENLKYENNKLVGVNGAIDRYTKINSYNHPLGKMPAVVLMASNGKFVCANYKGRVSLMTEAQLVNYANREGIANGKVVDGQIRAIEGSYKSKIVGMKESERAESGVEEVTEKKSTIIDRCHRDGKWYLTEELANYIFSRVEKEYIKGAKEKFGIRLITEIDEDANTFAIKGYHYNNIYDMSNIKVKSGAGDKVAETNTIAELIPMFNRGLAYCYEDVAQFKRAVELIYMAMDCWGCVIGNCLYLELPLVLSNYGEDYNISLKEYNKDKVYTLLKHKAGKMWELFWKFYMVDYLNNGRELELYNNNAIENKDSVDAVLVYTYIYMPNIVTV